MYVVCADVWITTSGTSDSECVPYYFNMAVSKYVKENANTDKKPILVGVTDAGDWCDKIIEQCHDVSTVDQQVRCRLFLPVHRRTTHTVPLA